MMSIPRSNTPLSPPAPPSAEGIRAGRRPKLSEDVVRTALAATPNRREAAILLGVSHKTLKRSVKLLGLQSSPTGGRAPSGLNRADRRRRQRAGELKQRASRYYRTAACLTEVIEELHSLEDSDLRDELRKLALRIEARGERDEKADREFVLEVITHNYSNCVEDIYDDTRIAKPQIWKILDSLIASGRVEERQGGDSKRRDEVSTLFYAR
jgi:hypothetical protein